MTEQLPDNANVISTKLCNELACTLEQIRSTKHKIAKLHDKKPKTEIPIDNVIKELSPLHD